MLSLFWPLPLKTGWASIKAPAGVSGELVSLSETQLMQVCGFTAPGVKRTADWLAIKWTTITYDHNVVFADETVLYVVFIIPPQPTILCIMVLSKFMPGLVRK